MNLAERNALLVGLSASYAVIDPQGQIQAHAPQFLDWIGETETSIVGRTIADLIPEFFGQEAAFAAVLASTLPFFKLEYVNRSLDSGLMRYLTFTLLGGQHVAASGWLLVVQDVSMQGENLQELTQRRNELALLRRKLDEANRQLDDLLHVYLPPEVADRLVDGGLRAELGGELREVTVLFADIRGYTSAAEHLPPAATMRMLNEHLSVVVAAITTHGGIVAQFQGDNVMALFNAPTDQPDHALRAVRAALEAQRTMTAHHSGPHAEQLRLSFGIGINTGMALVGNSGGFRRYTYTAIGDTVNLAARITAVTPAGAIMISHAVYEHLAGVVETESMPAQRFKGKTQATLLHRVVVFPAQDQLRDTGEVVAPPS